MIVEITGARHSGKTTLVEGLVKRLRERELRVVAVQDVHRIGSITEVLRRQVGAERVARTSKADVVLVDRTIYDWLYSAIRFAKADIVEALKDYALYARENRYDLILFCRPIYQPAMRSEQIIQDRAIEAILAPVKTTKVYLSGTPEERINRAEKAILEVLEKWGLCRG